MTGVVVVVVDGDFSSFRFRVRVVFLRSSFHAFGGLKHWLALRAEYSLVEMLLD